MLLLALPGITVSLGILAVVLATPSLYFAYGTNALTVLALAVAMAPIANRLTDAAVIQVGEDMEEAARMSGASARRAVIGILVRLVLPSFVASWFVTGIMAAGNLDIPALLSATGAEPLTLLSLDIITSGSYTQASALSCLFLGGVAILTALFFGTVRLVGSRQRRLRETGPTETESPPLSEPQPSALSVAGKH